MANSEGKMAIAKDPKELAKKLVKTSPENYVTGVEGKAGLKKFSSKHSVLKTDAPNDTEENNDAVFSGAKQDKENTTRRADMSNTESEVAYESAAFDTLNPTGSEDDENAQKVHAVTSGEKGPEAGFNKAKPKHEKKETKGTETSEPIGKIKTALPPQVAWTHEETKKNNSLQEDHSDAATELVLHADNDRNLYRSSYVPVAKNLERKYKKGVYDHAKAKKLWQYHADRAAQSYAKEHGDGTPWHRMFSTADRKSAAEHFADQHHAEMEAGNFHEGVKWNHIPPLSESLTLIRELGEPMSPAPATSDNPGGADQNNMTASKDANGEGGKDQDDNEEKNDSDSASQLRDDLETIAMMAAEMYEDVQDDSEIPDWALEKIDLAKNFLSSVQDTMGGGSDNDEDSESDLEPKEKPTAFKTGQAAMAKEEFAESVLAKLRRKYGE